MLIAPDALLVLLGALLIDAIVGDPDVVWRRWPHPVVWMGRLIGWGDTRLNRASDGDGTRRLLGAVWLLVVIAVSGLVGFAIEFGLRALPGGSVLVAAAAAILIAQKSLHDHVARVRDAFPSGGLPAARRAVAMIVGRDPDSLDGAGVSRAAIETTFENFSDGIVAPAFFFALAGLPGLVVFKVVNTADSMIGHLSEQHRAFGWAAARLDDALNLLPARLSAALLALASPVVGGSPVRTALIVWRDAGLHRSPNAGWPESAAAGALGLALAGPRVYAAGPVDEPFLNAGGRRDADAADIGRGLRLLVAACALHAAGYGLLALAFR